eukprot:COSAG06_NODE_11164_length_1553_cov_1.706327_1_plen_71_part_00
MTKEVIEVQKRMEDLIQSAEAVGTRLSAVGGGAGEQIPSFSEFMDAQQRAAQQGGSTGGQIASPRISHRD